MTFIDSDGAEDWIKQQSWDVTRHDDELVATVDDLMWALGVDGATDRVKQRAVDRFMKLPAAVPMPDGLLAQLVADGWVM